MLGPTVVDGELVVNNGYWDTYRTEWPALALLDPELTGGLLDGQLSQYRRGGWMARWSAPGYVDSMVGTSSDQIFADAARWGVAFDHAEAFESGWRNACEPGPDAPEVFPKALLVPLVAFDRRGGRIGYGKGHFDRAIAALEEQHPVLTIGLAYAVQEIDEVPVEPHDRPLDIIITETELIRTKSA